MTAQRAGHIRGARPGALAAAGGEAAGQSFHAADFDWLRPNSAGGNSASQHSVRLEVAVREARRSGARPGIRLNQRFGEELLEPRKSSPGKG